MLSKSCRPSNFQHTVIYTILKLRMHTRSVYTCTGKQTHRQTHIASEVHTQVIHTLKITCAQKCTQQTNTDTSVQTDAHPQHRHVETDTHHIDTHPDPPEGTQTNACTHTQHTNIGTLAPATPTGLCPRAPGARGGARMARPRAPCSFHSPGTLTGPIGMTGPDIPGRAPPTRNQQPNSAATIALRSAALQAAAGTRRRSARPRRRACAVRSRRPSTS